MSIDDMEVVFSHLHVESYTECLAIFLFVDKQADTLNVRMSRSTAAKNKGGSLQIVHVKSLMSIIRNAVKSGYGEK